ncbi:SDR family NAD(P)-dependent oxidoreductase [Streptomyces sp. NPDC050759]|uniref:SDR family NAD(P)-dependent oxidoreductase n=1 Tax=Streptomyces sp. NPDC050759 TaxID=3365635 RepID=UPI00379E4DB5
MPAQEAPLAGRAAVITGVSRGLGRVLMRRFLAEGALVLGAARGEADIGELVERYPGRVAFHRADVTDADSARLLLEAAAERFGQVDVLVANAGVSRPGPVAQLSPEHWREVIDVNLTGTFHSIQAAVPYLEKSPYARVITLSSALAGRVAVGAAAYSASKAGVEMLTRVCAIELVAKGITVNCLSPGIIDEGMGRALAAHQEVWNRFKPKLAMGRPGTAQEVADAAVFLAGDQAAYVNGHVLEVNGGLDW